MALSKREYERARRDPRFAIQIVRAMEARSYPPPTLPVILADHLEAMLNDGADSPVRESDSDTLLADWKAGRLKVDACDACDDKDNYDQA